MPNWCNNTLTLSHPDPKKMELIVEAIRNNRLCETIKPVPQELLETVAGCMGAGTPEQEELEAKQLSNRKKYGYSDWHEFTTHEWGTKWDICDARIIEDLPPQWLDKGNGLELTDYTVRAVFDKAWCSPSEIYVELFEQGYEVDAKYYESGCGFAGWFTNEGGNSYFEWESLENARDILPTELDEEFNIIENLEMWEEDQDEEHE